MENSKINFVGSYVLHDVFDKNKGLENTTKN